MTLCRLIYCSNAMPDIDYISLKDIMDKSVKNNSRLGVTGMLCFGNSMFLQTLEGERQIVSERYHVIAQDKRHFSPVIIECVEIENRMFLDWSMKLVNLGEYAPQTVKNLCLKYSPTPDFYPKQMTAKQCLGFLGEFCTLLNPNNS